MEMIQILEIFCYSLFQPRHISQFIYNFPGLNFRTLQADQNTGVSNTGLER